MEMFDQELAILFSGEAGQGLNTIEQVLSRMLKNHGMHVFTSKEIMSRIRGGLNTSLLRVSSQVKGAYRRYPDLLFSFQKGGLKRLDQRISKQATVFFDPAIEEGPARGRGIGLDMTRISREAGGKLFLNVAFVGLVWALLNFNRKHGELQIGELFSEKKPDENRHAFEVGYQLGAEFRTEVKLEGRLQPDQSLARARLLEGSQAVGAGALAGGLNFIASYPMSPSTSVLMFLARQADKFGLLVEQAEDEISAINMCLGAWYAGARAMVTTSGGGFALMEEGISLAGITETPAVIHLAQRPGPGTGLPTRTEQGDLNLALYSGHGDLPRLILAPGTAAQAFAITRHAFDLADQFQIPVFILTDQFFLDSIWTEQNLQYDGERPAYFTVESREDYQRYQPSESGISPRAVPGAGRGFVRADSDEHDERGEITEDFSVRTAQVDKRMGKASQLPNDESGFEVMGKPDQATLLVTWGSNYYLGQEVVSLLRPAKVACIHFSQLYPVPRKAANIFAQAKLVINLENNWSGQFGGLLQQQLGVRIDRQILQYNGLPFAIEDVLEEVRSLIS